MMYTVVWLKLISYISVNMWNRMGLTTPSEKNGESNESSADTLEMPATV